MNTERIPKFKSRISRGEHNLRGRGRGSAINKRHAFNSTRIWRKRARLPCSGVFPRNAISGSSSATSSLETESELLQRPVLFTAPNSSDIGQLQVLPIVNPGDYTGWRLYFPTETFKGTSPLVTKIKAFEEHIIQHPECYVLQDICQQRWFNVHSEFLLKDSKFVASWNNFCEELLQMPIIVLSSLGVAMHRVATSMINTVNINDNLKSNAYTRKTCVHKLIARPVGFFSVTHMSDITQANYEKLLVVNGCVKSITAVEKKLTWMAYKCKRCGYEQAIRQKDYYPTKPLRCRMECNSKSNFIELRSSPYTRIECFQMIKLSEKTLQCEPTFSVVDIDIEFRSDLVDRVCPGSNLTVTGILKIKSLDKSDNSDFNYKFTNPNAYMQAVSVITHTNSENSHYKPPTDKDLEIVQMITREPNCLRLLVQSLVPELCGYEMAKVAVLLSLFGGSGSQLHDECDIHVLVVGDPGVGKSKLLQSAAIISEKGNLVSGKGTPNFMSTVQQEKQSTIGNVRSFIDTGCILMSNNGHCCIDDMDKLLSNQAYLINIVQTKSVTVQSTRAIFNVAARTSVISAVNPVAGHYDSAKQLSENVRLSSSLRSLFHMVFVIFDKADKYADNMLAEHIKALHSGTKKTLSLAPKYCMESEKNDGVQMGEVDLVERLKINCDEPLDLLPTILLQKYIEYARQNIKPLLTQDAINEIKEYYLELRETKGHSSITTRQLDGLIRLTQARAKIDLSPEASKKHSDDVINLSRFSYMDMSVTDQANEKLNGSTPNTSHGHQVKKFIQLLQIRANALGRKIFEFEELKDMASQAGIKCGVTNLVDIVNMQGYLLKKGSNLYEIITQ